MLHFYLKFLHKPCDLSLSVFTRSRYPSWSGPKSDTNINIRYKGTFTQAHCGTRESLYFTLVYLTQLGDMYQKPILKQNQQISKPVYLKKN